MQKALGDLIKKEEEYSFFIPYYQRGYRWEKPQIHALLNDLLEFYRKIKADTPNYKYYSLQPLVVKKEENVYRVIDGQQRLTTIFLILSVFEEFAQTRKKPKFFLTYDREGSKEFLEEIINNDVREKNKKQNIDFFFMSNAFDDIWHWIKDKMPDEDDIESFMNFIRKGSDFLEEKDINKNIRFIWYELDEKDDEFDTFIRLNIGKIPLTNAELIKSFIIQKITSQEKRFEISKEWDDIEYFLNNSEFFGFLTKEKISTRIELLFRILLNKEKYKDFQLYEKFVEKYEKDDILKLWKSIKEIYYILLYWFENREFYHLIGYLVAIDKSIIDIWNNYSSHSGKDEFKKSIIKDISNILKIKITNDDITLHDEPLRNLYYGHKDTKKVLLLFNILTLLASSKESYIKFSFDLFNNEKWSIEHIHPQTDKLEVSLKVTKFKDELKFLHNDEVNQILSKSNNSNQKDLIGNLEEVFSDKEIKEDNDNIKNLTLLSSSINSSLKNNFFPIKRKMIVNKDAKGEFIPIATKNLFLKYYSDFTVEECNMMKWTNSDGEQYINTIETIFINFFKESEI